MKTHGRWPSTRTAMRSTSPGPPGGTHTPVQTSRWMISSGNRWNFRRFS